MASRTKGAASLRRLLRRLPDAMRDGLADELRAIGNRLLGRAKAETPRRSGRLAAALRVRVAAKTLMLTLGLLSKSDRRRFFYGYILDEGRAAKQVTIKRGPRAGSTMRISPIARERYNFVFGRRRDFQENEIPKLRGVLERVLSQVSRGSGND